MTETSYPVSSDIDLDGIVYQVGAEDRFSEVRASAFSSGNTPSSSERPQRALHEALKELRIRLGTLLKVDNVSVLLGAGTSKDAGGVLLGSIPLDIERLLYDIATDAPWLYVFFCAAKHVAWGSPLPTTKEEVAERIKAVHSRPPSEQITALPVSYERLLTVLWAWRSAWVHNVTSITTPFGGPVTSADLDTCIGNLTTALADRCDLPQGSYDADPLIGHRALLRRILTRPLNLRRANLFTINYDLLIEKAADANGLVLLDGFLGTVSRVFRPECYDHDLYFPGETTEGRVQRLDRVLHLYKLHGSINWVASEPVLGNPYGITALSAQAGSSHRVLIYPTPTKYGDTLGMPYAELFRRFAAAIVRPQSTLIVIGYSFGDEHVNAIIHQALTVPSFSLVVVDPTIPSAKPDGTFVERLRAANDPRMTFILGKPLGLFAWFSQNLLPDLHEEQVERNILATFNALARSSRPDGSGGSHA